MIKEIFSFKFRNRFYRLIRTKVSFCFHIFNENIDKKYYIQISTKEPWIYPKKDTILEGEVTLWGWMFFYVGCDTKILDKIKGVNK